MVIAISFMLGLGTIMFNALEGWSFVDSFYFVTMTATTVGYGDFTPTHTISKIITIIYSLMIIPFILYAFSVIAKFQVESVNRRIHRVVRKVNEQEEELEKTERKVSAARRELKEQEKELETTEKKLKKQEKITREQQEELEGHQKKIKKTEKVLKEQEENLEVVEEVVEEKLVEDLSKQKKPK